MGGAHLLLSTSAQRGAPQVSGITPQRRSSTLDCRLIDCTALVDCTLLMRLTAAALLLATAAAQCPAGYTAQGSKCYKRLSSTGTPAQCIARCRGEQATLPCVANEAENNALVTLAGTNSGSCGFTSQRNCVWICRRRLGGGQPLMIECGNEKKNGVTGVRGAERAREGVRMRAYASAEKRSVLWLVNWRRVTAWVWAERCGSRRVRERGEARRTVVWESCASSRRPLTF